MARGTEAVLGRARARARARREREGRTEKVSGCANGASHVSPRLSEVAEDCHHRVNRSEEERNQGSASKVDAVG